MSRKFALVIGTSEYADRRLSGLTSPEADVTGLSEVLASPELGQFDEVKTLVNERHQPLLEEIWRFLGGDKRADDFVLVYYSGHGVKDDQGRLYLACPDTDVDLLRATAIPAAELNDSLNECRARRQVLILDCCNSGAFRHGAKGVRGESVGTKTAFGGSAGGFRGEGQGRVIITATDATQYAMEGDDLLGDAQRSVFTRHLLDGLRTGEADQNGDGWIGVDELYDYVHWKVVEETPGQQPCKFADDVRGEFVIARRPRGTEKPAPLPAALAEDLRSTSVQTRLGAVEELGIWLGGVHIGRVLAAIETLRGVVASDDSNRVRARAQEVLDQNKAALENALAATPARITVLTDPLRREPERPRPAPAPPAPAPAAPAAPVPSAVSQEEAWRAWALRETHGDQGLAAAAVGAAMVAAAHGADSSTAADAARNEIARLRAAAAAPRPAPPPAVRPAPPLPVVARPRPPEATTSLVLGIVGVFTCGLALILGPLAIWYGLKAQRIIRANPGQLGGDGYASAGIALGVVGLIVFAVEALFYFAGVLASLGSA